LASLVFSLIILITPAYANVTTVSMEKSFYTVDEKISFIGTESEGGSIVTVIVRAPDGHAELLGGFSDPQGEYETTPRNVKTIFSIQGIYNVTAFTDKIENGISMQVEFDGTKVAPIPDFVLALNSISDKTIEEEKTLVFTPTLTQSLTGVIFSLEKNPPTGASINSETGQFTWTPTESQGPASYVFEIVVKKGASEDREDVKITVTELSPPIQPEQTQEPEPTPVTESEPTPEPTPVIESTQELGIASFVDPTKDPQSYVNRYNNEPKYKEWFDTNFPEYSSIYQAVGLEKPLQVPAPFVDPTKDPQSYVNRYNNEPKYKEWFDTNFPEYSSIYQAVGLEKPKEIASFVDPTLDPQFYIDRYNNEPTFKDWFDTNFPDMTIYDAVGLDESEIKEQESGQCGTGTILVDGVCTVDDNLQGGGCLIATAAYGSEMAPQVQFLREIRDNKVMNTESGALFMSGFNQLYYSFSPSIADLERENPAFKEMVKIGIAPMLSSLSIMSAADSEQEILGYGIGVILMNVGMYFVAPVMLFFGIKKAKTRLSF
jgi:hypothetical protein